MSSESPKKPAAKPETGAPMQLKWDDSNMKSSYANVCNAMSTREEVVLMFGVNQAWHGGQKEVTIQLTDRIILSPHAAKRLTILLNNLIKQHEDRFGVLNIEPPKPLDMTVKSGFEN
ncbi:MAG TPA: DUF3467 domain-containing protein [Terriglobia bacterium]|nr:DUF3467 domain-containing protein [Terriglobia bacterium]